MVSHSNCIMKEKESAPEIKPEKQKCIFDIPDEILEDNLLTFLSFNDLMNLMNTGSERLYNCSNNVIKKKRLASNYHFLKNIDIYKA